MGTVVLVGTPIGNDGDWTDRAKRVLAEADLVAAEDTRVARDRLARVGVTPRRIIAYHDHNAREVAGRIAARLGEGTCAVVSDAGMPLVSDPGYRLVLAAVEAGHTVDVVPGPSAVLAALAVAGLPTDRFQFVGFPPRTAGKRRAWLADLAPLSCTWVAFEAPHRILATLAAAAEALGDRSAVLAISLTKQWQRFHRGTLPAIHAAMAADPDDVIGEMTLVVAGAPALERGALDPTVAALVDGLAAAGVPAGTVRDVVAEVYGLPRRVVYQRALHGPQDTSGRPAPGEP